jgi:ABC-type lipoprotein release transport system permease subunit
VNPRWPGWAVFAWLRQERRRRWRSLLVLVLLVAVASGIVMAAVAGARRGASALQRLQSKTLPATAAILPTIPGFDWARIRALPEVESLTTFAVGYSYYFDGISHQIGLGGASLESTLAGAYPAADEAVMRSIEKPVVLAGRVFDPARDDEVVVSRKFVKHFHKRVGDTLVLHLPSPGELADGLDGTSDKLIGPRLQMKIVGVVDSPWFSDSPNSLGIVVMSPGVVTRHPANTVGDPTNPQNPNTLNALVRLRGGEPALPGFERDLIAITGRSDLDVWNLADQFRPEQREISFEARCLVAFAGAGLLAALFLIGQAINRHVAASAGELETLRALGMTARQAVLSAAAGPIVAGATGALLGVFVAAAGSVWFPIGTASLLEPLRGVSWDWTVIATGLFLVVVLVCLGATGAGWLALRARRGTFGSKRSGVAAVVARLGFAVPVVVGVRFALEAGRGRTSVPVRPALVGAVVGVLGVVAAFTFSSGASGAVSHPARFGQTFQIGGFVGINGQDYFPIEKLMASLARDDDVVGIDDARIGVATGAQGHRSISLVTYAAGPKPLPVVVTSGRLPDATGEVMLAPRTLTALHATLGSQVSLYGSRGHTSFTVVGIGLVPQGTHNAYADGGWLTPAGYNTIFTGFNYRFLLVSARDGLHPESFAATLGARVAKNIAGAQGFAFNAPSPVVEISELRQVRLLPTLLGAFLGLLALAAVGHALISAVHRRSYDLAVLRALGLTGSQGRLVVLAQAVVLAVIGVVFGVPLGLALGRTVWRAVASYMPIQYVAPTPGWTLILIAPAVVVAAIVLAAWPANRAARLRVAEILRAE